MTFALATRNSARSSDRRLALEGMNCCLPVHPLTLSEELFASELRTSLLVLILPRVRDFCRLQQLLEHDLRNWRSLDKKSILIPVVRELERQVSTEARIDISVLDKEAPTSPSALVEDSSCKV